jgi:phytoene desaturase
MKNKSVIVVGAGVGGIAASIALTKQGFQVRVFEKNSNPGGRCGHFFRDGHRFDLGATLLLMPSIYREVFEYLEMNFEECLDLTRLEDIYTIYFSGDRKLAFSQDENRMKEQLEGFESGSYEKYQTYIRTGYNYYRIALTKLLGRNYYKFTDFVNLPNLIRLLKLKTYIRHSSYVKRFFKHPELQQAFSFQNIYVGQSVYQAPAFFSMLSAVELTEGTLFPAGGMYSIIEKLFETAKTSGVEFNFNRTVEKVITNNEFVKGIQLSDGSTELADIVLVNADLPNAYRVLLPDRRKAKRLVNKKYSCSAFVFHWGLDKVYSQLGHHSIFLSEEYTSNLKKIFREKALSSNPSFYVHAPARTDKTAAPPGMDTISVIVPVGHISEKHAQPWEEFRVMARKSIIQKLVRFGLDDIEDHIKFEVCYNPLTWENNYRVEKGGVFGSLSHAVFQMGYFRPPNRDRKYRNLYFVGGSTHPGNGVPLVLLSAKLTSERILKENL